MCMGGSSHILRCLKPRDSGGFQVPPHQWICSGTNLMQLRHVTHLLTQDVILSVGPDFHCPSSDQWGCSCSPAVWMPRCWVVWSLLFLLLKIRNRIRNFWCSATKRFTHSCLLPRSCSSVALRIVQFPQQSRKIQYPKSLWNVRLWLYFKADCPEAAG